MTTNDSLTGAPEAPVKAGRREWIGLAVLALPVLLLSLDMSVLYLAIPHLGADLQPSSTELLWILDIYGFMIAGFLITMGTLGDRIGRRRLLLIGAGLFAVVSVFAAFSSNAVMLIVARALLGIAGATQMPSTLSLIGNMFRDPRERSTAIGVWMSCFMVGSVIGPLVGGLLLQYFSWGSVFLLGVPIMVLLLATGPFLLPEYKDPDPGRLDLLSVALSLAAILPIIYGLKELAKHGLNIASVAAVAGGLAFGAVFVRRQLRLTSPLFDLRLFRSLSFSSSLGIMSFGGFIMGGTMLFFTQYLQVVVGLSPVQAGLWTIPAAVSMTVALLCTPLVARRVRPGVVIGGGLVLSAVAFVVLSQVDSDTGFAAAIIGSILLHVGIAPSSVLITDFVVGSAPPEKSGSASALSETSAEFGIALGVAALGSIGTAVYRSRVEDAIPDNVPTAAADAARDTLVTAVAAVDQLPDGTGERLLEAARDAFMAGFNAVAIVSVAIVLVLACASFVLLRGVRPSGEKA